MISVTLIPHFIPIWPFALRQTNSRIRKVDRKYLNLFIRNLTENCILVNDIP